jgi:hypothetical protein
VFGFHLSSKSQHYCTNWKYWWKNSLPAVLQEHKLWVILRLLNTNQAPTGFQALDWAPGIWRKTTSKPTSKWERIGCAPWFCFRWGHLKNGTDWQGSLKGVAWTKAYTSTVFTTPFCCFVLQTLSSSLKILGGFIWALEPVRSSYRVSIMYQVSYVFLNVFDSTGVWTQDFALARQAEYHLSHASSLCEVLKAWLINKELC